MANRVIELHDSEVSEIFQASQQVTVRFSAAYVHESEGTPGVDPGKGYVQGAELIVNKATMEGGLPDFPADISEGSLTLNGMRADNEIPVPFIFSGDFLMELTFISGHRIKVTGAAGTLSLFGDPEYVEDFPGGSE